MARDACRLLSLVRASEHALSARREYQTKDGQIMQGGPDHYARLAATKHFRDFLATEEKRQLMTLQELKELLRANKVLPD